MSTSLERLEQICDLIFNEKNFTNVKWHKKSDDHAICFETRSKGIESDVTIIYNPRNKNRASAILTVGRYATDYKHCVRNEISFNIWKKDFHYDFLGRLGLNQFDIYVENIKSEREKRQEQQDNFNYKIEAFKKCLPFYKSSNDDLELTIPVNGELNTSINVSHTHNQRPVLQISAKVDVIIQICAILGQNINILKG